MKIPIAYRLKKTSNKNLTYASESFLFSLNIPIDSLITHPVVAQHRPHHHYNDIRKTLFQDSTPSWVQAPATSNPHEKNPYFPIIDFRDKIYIFFVPVYHSMYFIFGILLWSFISCIVFSFVYVFWNVFTRKCFVYFFSYLDNENEQLG